MTVMSTRGDYQEQAQGRLNEIEAMLNVFRSRLNVATRCNRAGGQQKLRLLRGQKLILENRLSELLASNESIWPKQRIRFEDAAKCLENATSAALKKLR